MKTISATALAALLTATIGFSALPAYAQQTPPPAPQEQMQPGGPHGEPGGPRDRGPADFLRFERGAEAVEIGLVRLSHAIELTDAQQPLFDALRTAAVDAAETLGNTMESLRPAAPVEGETPAAPNFADLLDMRIALDKARLAALESVQPEAKAFFDSLTDEQKATLAAERPHFGKDGPRDGGPQWSGQHHDGHGQHGGHGGGQHGPAEQGGPAPQAPMAPAASDAPPAPDATDAPAAPDTSV